MSLDAALSSVTKSVPECVAAGFVDMKSGMLIGVRTVDSHSQEVLDLVAAATSDLFQGQNVVAIEKLFKKERGIAEADDHHYFREIVVLSENLIHVFQRSGRSADLVLVIVCRASANMGMVLTKSRAVLPEVEAAA